MHCSLENVQYILKSFRKHEAPKATYLVTSWTHSMATDIVSPPAGSSYDVSFAPHISSERRLTVTWLLATSWKFHSALPKRWWWFGVIINIATPNYDQTFLDMARDGPPVHVATHAATAHHKSCPPQLWRKMILVVDVFPLKTLRAGYVHVRTNFRMVLSRSLLWISEY